MGDNMSRVTPILPVTHYNIACCYSMLDNVSGAAAETGAGLRVCPSGRMSADPASQPTWSSGHNMLGQQQCAAWLTACPGGAAQVDEGLVALRKALNAGFEDFPKVGGGRCAAAGRACVVLRSPWAAGGAGSSSHTCMTAGHTQQQQSTPAEGSQSAEQLLPRAAATTSKLRPLTPPLARCLLRCAGAQRPQPEDAARQPQVQRVDRPVRRARHQLEGD